MYLVQVAAESPGPVQTALSSRPSARPLSGHIARGHPAVLLHPYCNIELALATARLGAVFRGAHACLGLLVAPLCLGRFLCSRALSRETPALLTSSFASFRLTP